MSQTPLGQTDDYLKPAATPWWQSLRFRWLLIAPIVAAVGVYAMREPLDGLSSRIHATWQLDQALRAQSADDPATALEKLDQAIQAWPMSEQLYMLRAQMRRRAGDLRGSMEDYDIAIQLAPKFAEAYMQRAVVRRMLGYTTDALEDVNTAIVLRPRGEAEPLNLRAYLRALSGVELQEALVDIDKALSTVDSAPAAWLDTRACVLLGLGELDRALEDIDTALRLMETDRDELMNSERYRELTSESQQAWQEQYTESLSVMYHHRAQIYKAQGEADLADADARHAEQLGFRPEIE
ncbi:MAG: hypothetical protein KDA42_00285 [Planctomycetales bacterium]|nr:hypothetical protein [Planctomycetales bacterium]